MLQMCWPCSMEEGKLSGGPGMAAGIIGKAGHSVMLPQGHKILSSAYGESERLLATIFKGARDLALASQKTVLLFMDEVDTIAPADGGETPAITQRVLSTLLTHIDGFENGNDVIVIAATNKLKGINQVVVAWCVFCVLCIVCDVLCSIPRYGMCAARCVVVRAAGVQHTAPAHNT